MTGNIDELDDLRNWLKGTSSFQHSPPLAPGPMLVLGAGTMGTQIAMQATEVGLEVGLFDLSLQNALDLRDQLQAQYPGSSIVVHRELNDISSVPYALVVETIVEKLAAKRRLFSQLERLVSKNALLATNTSTIPLMQLSESMQEPQRLVGMHFLLPVLERELIEVVMRNESQMPWVRQACQWCQRLQKLPLVVKDEIGFLVNRLLNAVLAQSIELWATGVSPRDIDIAALELGLGFGPFIAMDHIGLETVVRAGAGFWQKFPGRPRPSPILPALLKRQRLGRKSLQGIFDYHHMTPVDSTREAQLEFLSRIPNEGPCREVTPAEIQSSLWTALVSEAIAVCHEGYVDDPRAVDAAWIFGLGIARDPGGPFEWARRSGNVEQFSWDRPEVFADRKQRLLELALMNS
jgi:3-hydroxyacyl-CoA dehydrogenase/enoyl-CoA hydratase/3-hydroxybutyryl-CoA epimerase